MNPNYTDINSYGFWSFLHYVIACVWFKSVPFSYKQELLKYHRTHERCGMQEPHLNPSVEDYNNVGIIKPPEVGYPNVKNVRRKTDVICRDVFFTKIILTDVLYKITQQRMKRWNNNCSEDWCGMLLFVTLRLFELWDYFEIFWPKKSLKVSLYFFNYFCFDIKTFMTKFKFIKISFFLFEISFFKGKLNTDIRQLKINTFY